MLPKRKNGVLLTMKELSLLSEGNMKTVRNRLRKLIEEERGISTEVDYFINQLYQDILHPRIKEIIKKETYTVNTNFNGRKLSITFHVFVCKTKKEEETLLTTNPDAANAYSLYAENGQFLRSIVSPLVVVGGNIDILKLFDDLQHEVNHVYEQDCIGNEYKNIDLNAYVMSNLYSKQDEKRMPARLLYYGNPIEQDAFVNGLYGAVMASLKNGVYPIDKNKIEVFTAYKELCQAYKYILDNRNNEALLREIQINYHTKYFHYTYHRLKDRGRQAIAEFERKINKTLQKCEKDAAKLGTRTTDIEHWLI